MLNIQKGKGWGIRTIDNFWIDLWVVGLITKDQYDNYKTMSIEDQQKELEKYGPLRK